MIHLGTDAICWHARLAAGQRSLLDVLDESAEIGADFVQFNLHYANTASPGDTAVAERATQRGLALLTSGSPIGRRYHDGEADRAIGVVVDELHRAHALGSPSLMIHSRVYSPETAGRPAERAAELQHLGTVLDGVVDAAASLGVQVLYENASDFQPAELVQLVVPRASDHLGFFLDLTNAYSVFADPIETIRQLAPFAPAGHVKDFGLESIWTDDEYHRRAFQVAFRYPGEGIADLPELVGELMSAIGDRTFHLSVEGLDSHVDVDDQRERLRSSFTLLRDLLPVTA